LTDSYILYLVSGTRLKFRFPERW